VHSLPPQQAGLYCRLIQIVKYSNGRVMHPSQEIK
jgi:hypothetical protein